MPLNIADLFIIASILQGMAIGIAILRIPYFRSPANRYLGWSLIVLGGILFLGWQDFDVVLIDWFWTIMWEYLFAALIFCYFLKALEHPFWNEHWRRWLFAPFLISLPINLVFDLDFVFELYELPFSEQNIHYLFYEELEDALAVFLNLIAMLGAYWLVKQHKSTPLVKRRWLLRFSGALLFIVGIWSVSNAIESRYSIEDPFSMIWIAISILFWWVAYAGVYKMRLAEEQLELHELNRSRLPRREIVAISAEENGAPLQGSRPGEGYATELSRLMEEEQLYRNPDLGRKIIAEYLGISEGYVSQVMSEQVGESFADYVSTYRIAEAKRLLGMEEFDRYSLEAIGLEAGFKSRSAFYSTFKKATGLTPGLYRKQGKTS